MLLALCQNCMCVPWLLFEGKHLVSCFGNFRISVRFFLLLCKLSVPFEVRFPLKHCAANLLCHVWHLFKHIAGCCWRLYTTATAIWIFFFMNIFKSTLMKHFNSKFRFSNLVLMRKKRLLSLFIFQCELLLLTRNLEFKKVLATVKRYAGKETFLFLPTGCSLHDSRSFSVFN